MTAKIYYDADADLSLLKGKKIAIIGYGSQGHAHALNLRDSGMDVRVGLKKGSASWPKAENAGFTVREPARATAEADIIMILTPDEVASEMYESDICMNLKPGTYLACAHGFNIHFKKIVPPADVNVFMVAPKGPGHLLRSEFEKGKGVPCLIAVAQDPSGNSKQIALAYGSALGGGRAALLETNFREETETDLFGEQTVLCGGLTELMRAGFETLVEAGYAPEMAYFECLHEVKLIVDLIYEGGIANMRYSISNTAEYGDMTRGKRVIGDETREAMKQILADIQSGKFADEWITEYRCGLPHFRELRKEAAKHPVEEVGAKLRGLIPWLASDRLFDRSRNYEFRWRSRARAGPSSAPPPACSAWSARSARSPGIRPRSCRSWCRSASASTSSAPRSAARRPTSGWSARRPTGARWRLSGDARSACSESRERASASSCRRPTCT